MRTFLKILAGIMGFAAFLFLYISTDLMDQINYLKTAPMRKERWKEKKDPKEPETNPGLPDENDLLSINQKEKDDEKI